MTSRRALDPGRNRSDVDPRVSSSHSVDPLNERFEVLVRCERRQHCVDVDTEFVRRSSLPGRRSFVRRACLEEIARREFVQRPADVGLGEPAGELVESVVAGGSDFVCSGRRPVLDRAPDTAEQDDLFDGHGVSKLYCRVHVKLFYASGCVTPSPV